MSRKKQHIIQLTDQQRQDLSALLKTGKHPARVLRRAQILLWCDAGKSDKEISQLLNIVPATVTNTRQKWITETSVEDRPRSGRPSLLDGKQEALLVALACSDAPGERESWTMQLLAHRLVELQVVDEISDETVRLRLKKCT